MPHHAQSSVDDRNESFQRFLPLDNVPPTLHPESFAAGSFGDDSGLRFSISQLAAGLSSGVASSTPNSVDSSSDATSISNVERDLTHNHNEDSSIRPIHPSHFGTEASPCLSMDNQESDSMIIDRPAAGGSPLNPSMFTSPTNTNSSPGGLITGPLEHNRSAMSFMTALALGIPISGTANEREILSHGPVTAEEVLKHLQMQQAWRNIADARGLVDDNKQPSVETSSPSTNSDDLDFLHAAISPGTTTDELDWNGLTTWLSDDLVNPAIAVPAPNLSKEIIEYRRRADAYTRYRFNKSTAESIDTINHLTSVRCTIPSRKPIIVYPMRLHNLRLPGRTTEKLLPSFLRLALQQDFGDIVLVAAHFEADGLVTMDIGFRYAEDAFALWVKCGFLFEGHYWNVEPLKRMGTQTVMFPPPLEPKSHQRRYSRLQNIISYEFEINDASMGRCMQQMRRLLADLEHPETIDLDAVGEPLDPGQACSAPVKIIEAVEWAPLSEGGLGVSMRSWDVANGLLIGPQEPVDLAFGKQWPDVTLEMSARQRNNAYRDSHYTARRKRQVWKSIGLPPLPPMLEDPKDETTTNSLPEIADYDALLYTIPRDNRLYQGFVELWEWYQLCLRIVSDIRTKSARRYNHLTQLPTPSTLEDRICAAQLMSLKALESALLPAQRLADIRGHVYLVVWRAIASIAS
ncbi:hypothetical protein FS842_005245 [Serendipita sp. 407]|nr:hypothetical protein FS842_005245 [Serendipita sp. 407]